MKRHAHMTPPKRTCCQRAHPAPLHVAPVAVHNRAATWRLPERDTAQAATFAWQRRQHCPLTSYPASLFSHGVSGVSYNPCCLVAIDYMQVRAAA
eukprot:6211991-Pleurochrysis_carterae.AAC.7